MYFRVLLCAHCGLICFVGVIGQNTVNGELKDVGVPSSDEVMAQDLMEGAARFGPFADSNRIYLSLLDTFSIEAGLTYYRIQSNYMLGKHYLLKLQTTPAKLHFRIAAAIAKREKEFELQGFALDRLGVAYINEKSPDSALLCFQQSSDIYRANDLMHRLWVPYQGISDVYQFKGDYEKAKKYGELGLSSIENFDEPIARVILLNHLLTLSREFDQLEDYAHYLNLYLEDFDPAKLGSEDMHLVAYYNTIDDPKKLIHEIESAIKQLSRFEPTLSLLSSYYHLGKARARTGQTEKAIEAWKKGLKIDKTVEGIGYSLAYTQNLAEAYKSLGNYQQALVYFEENAAFSNQLLQSESTKKIDELQLKYETVQKENTIQAQKYDLANQKRQRNLILAVASAFIALAFMFIYGLRSRIKGQRLITDQKSELQQQEIRDLQQQNEVLALHAMIRGQEEERKRIAQDLHDGLGGLLSTVKLNFQGLTDHDSPEVTKTGVLIDDACSEVRRISHNMMPHALMRMGLTAAIQDLVAQLQGGDEMNFSFQNLSYKGTLEEDQEIMVYRIVQELLTNAVKHSRASTVIVQISQHNGTFSLVVEDDGMGFEEGDADFKEGLGLKSVNSRVHLLNGKSNIDSKKDEGVTITIEIPVNHLAQFN
jgi:two-component system, NarL family, sensor kinase